MLKNYVPLSEIVPIRAQLKDGNPDLKIIARVFSKTNRLLAELTLVHFEKGLYYTNSFRMPDEDFISVQYDTGNDFYGLAVENFYVERPAPEAPKFSVGVIVSVTPNGPAIGSIMKRERLENATQDN